MRQAFLLQVCPGAGPAVDDAVADDDLVGEVEVGADEGVVADDGAAEGGALADDGAAADDDIAAEGDEAAAPGVVAEDDGRGRLGAPFEDDVAAEMDAVLGGVAGQGEAAWGFGHGHVEVEPGLDVARREAVGGDAHPAVAGVAVDAGRGVGAFGRGDWLQGRFARGVEGEDEAPDGDDALFQARGKRPLHRGDVVESARQVAGAVAVEDGDDGAGEAGELVGEARGGVPVCDLGHVEAPALRGLEEVVDEAAAGDGQFRRACARQDFAHPLGLGDCGDEDCAAHG